MLSYFILAIIISTVVSLIVTPIVIKTFVRLSLVEDPLVKQAKTHNATATSTVPRGGGIPIFVSVILTSVIFTPTEKHFLGIMLAMTLALVVGLVDDIIDISPRFRLVINILTAVIIVAVGIGIAYVSNPFGGIIDLSWPRLTFDFFGQHSVWLLSDILAIIWIVACMNIVGWSAGVEGQLPGFVSVSAIFIGILGLRFSQDPGQFKVIILAGATAGAYLGFLPFNFYPQKIMPGYSGKSLAGLLLSTLAILSGAKLATVILLLGIPIIDATFVLARRIIFHHSLLQPNNIHLHHYLLNLGWSRQQVSYLYWGISLTLGIISLFLNSQQKFYAFFGLFMIFLGVVLKVYRRI